jgi:hypothetical protein
VVAVASTPRMTRARYADPLCHDLGTKITDLSI